MLIIIQTWFHWDIAGPLSQAFARYFGAYMEVPEITAFHLH